MFLDYKVELKDLLTKYEKSHLSCGENELIEKFKIFLQTHNECFKRSCLTGHFTASAFLLNPKRDKILLTHHKKLNKWLQLGGHADGDKYLSRVALKEAEEESGMKSLEFLNHREIIDIDAHVIPQHKETPTHIHYDVRFALYAQTEEFKISHESHDLRWVELDRVHQYTNEHSLLKGIEKTKQII